MTTGMPVESPVRGDVHAGFGGRVGETDQPRGWHRAPARPYTFRFNRRHSQRRGMMLFYRLLEQSIATDPVTYSSLIANPRATGRPHTAPARPGRVAPVPAVHRPWRQSAGNTRSPDLNG